MKAINAKVTRNHQITFAIAIFLMATAIYAQPINSTFSYQGRLDLGGQTADGFFDFEAVVFDALTSGDQVSPILTFGNVEVVEGLVNLSLDFGVDVFDGQERFLELRVRDLAGGGGLVILEPRQPILPTPYSLSTSKIDSDIFQRGTVGNCINAGSAGNSGTVQFPRAFSNTPIVFLTVDESVNNNGCVTARLLGRDPTNFSWAAYDTNGLNTCDCLHWLAIGEP